MPLFPVLTPSLLVAQNAVQAADRSQTERAAEASRLLDRAGRLLQTGQYVDTREARTQYRRLSDDLRTFRETGFRLEDARAAHPAWASGFLQVQYSTTDQPNGPNDAFRVRRARLNANYLVDARLVGRASVEATSGTSQTAPQLRDGFIQYRPGTFLDPKSTLYMAGQMTMPLGYEIQLPSGTRTWPERSQYEQTLFNGERNRGALAQFGTPVNYAFVGAFNALTINDPEGTNNPGGDDQIGPTAGVRFAGRNLYGGVSGFFARRPRYVTTSGIAPRADRAFLYGDLHYADRSPWEFWVEAMVGRDRIPQVTPIGGRGSSGLYGGHAQANYHLNAKDQLMLRTELFDRDLGDGRKALSLVGVGFLHDETANLRLTGTVEYVSDDAIDRGGDYGRLTLRAQFRF